jgi:hypothetical protein
MGWLESAPESPKLRLTIAHDDRQVHALPLAKRNYIHYPVRSVLP